MEHLKEGSGANETKFDFIWNKILEKKEYADQPVEKGHWALMTRDVIPDSRGESYPVQQAMFKDKPGWGVPKLLSGAVCLLMERISRGIYLYSREPLTYTCTEEAIGDGQLVVGGLGPFGLVVHNSIVFAPGNIGVGGLREFF